MQNSDRKFWKISWKGNEKQIWKITGKVMGKKIHMDFLVEIS